MGRVLSLEASAFADVPREFAFTKADFERVRRLIHQRAGIALSDAKFQLAYSRLARRLRVTEMGSFTDYLDAVESGAIDEWQEFINALTTNLTSFFREPHHFPILAEHLRRPGLHRTQRIWCTAASTGEEPYSIAMTALDALGDRGKVEILASDIDTNCLRTAQLGRYREDSIEKLDGERARRFFLRGVGANVGWMKVRPSLQSAVQFEQINLLATRYPFSGHFDVIFCRNVMIYFDKPTQLAVLRRFAELLTPDGLLFCGHSENFTQARDLFALRGKTVYALTKSTSPHARVATT